MISYAIVLLNASSDTLYYTQVKKNSGYLMTQRKNWRHRVSDMTEVKVIHLSNPFGLEVCTGYLMTQQKNWSHRVPHMAEVKFIHLSNPFGLEFYKGYLMTQQKNWRHRIPHMTELKVVHLINPFWLSLLDYHLVHINDWLSMIKGHVLITLIYYH